MVYICQNWKLNTIEKCGWEKKKIFFLFRIKPWVAKNKVHCSRTIIWKKNTIKIHVDTVINYYIFITRNDLKSLSGNKPSFHRVSFLESCNDVYKNLSKFDWLILYYCAQNLRRKCFHYTKVFKKKYIAKFYTEKKFIFNIFI